MSYRMPPNMRFQRTLAPLAPLKREPLGADGWNVENIIFILPAGSVARRGGLPAGVTLGDGREGQGDLPAIPARAAVRTGHGPGHGFAWRLARRPEWLARGVDCTGQGCHARTFPCSLGRAGRKVKSAGLPWPGLTWRWPVGGCFGSCILPAMVV